jgi:hypothetical protein
MQETLRVADRRSLKFSVVYRDKSMQIVHSARRPQPIDERKRQKMKPSCLPRAVRRAKKQKSSKPAARAEIALREEFSVHPYVTRTAPFRFKLLRNDRLRDRIRVCRHGASRKKSERAERRYLKNGRFTAEKFQAPRINIRAFLSHSLRGIR